MDRIAKADPVKAREAWVNGWNELMLDIWAERIYKLGVRDTDALYHSLRKAPVRHDDRFLELNLSHSFLEYGIWQDLGTGWGYSLDNGGDLKFLDESYRQKHRLNEPRKRGPKWGGGYTSGNTREPRRWESPKYYCSTLRLRDYMAESIGDEFKSIFCNALDTDNLRYSSDYYRKKGYTR